MCGHIDQRIPYGITDLAAVAEEIVRHTQWDPVVTPMHPMVIMTAEHGITAGWWGWRLKSEVRPHARRERLEESHLWRDSYRNRRCAIPCVAWWEAGWRFTADNLLWLAGIWRYETIAYPPFSGTQAPVIAIITGDAETKWHVHSDRHPIPLTRQQAQLWCERGIENTLEQPVTSLNCDGVTPRGWEQTTIFDGN